MSCETTNESKGWHIHLHILADIRWLDSTALSINWGLLLGEDATIVKVQDVRERSYLNEVTKYVVKASDMAKWPAEEIAAFIGSIKGVRMFLPFGSLYKLQRQIRGELDALRPPPEPCECGCEDFIYESDEASIGHECSRRRR